MIMLRPSSLLVLLMLASLAALCTGCTDTYKVNAAPLQQWPAHQQIQGKLTLRITEELGGYKYDKENMGSHEVYPFGPALASNSETMARQVFTDVTVVKGSTQASGLVLTPQVKATELTMSPWALEESDMT